VSVGGWALLCNGYQADRRWSAGRCAHLHPFLLKPTHAPRTRRNSPQGTLLIPQEPFELLVRRAITKLLAPSLQVGRRAQRAACATQHNS
jgi:hypothetical protein